MSRHLNTDKALVLFDRARPKLTSARYTPFIDYPSALATVLAFGDLIGCPPATTKNSGRRPRKAASQCLAGITIARNAVPVTTSPRSNGQGFTTSSASLNHWQGTCPWQQQKRPREKGSCKEDPCKEGPWEKGPGEESASQEGRRNEKGQCPGEDAVSQGRGQEIVKKNDLQDKLKRPNDQRRRQAKAITPRKPPTEGWGRSRPPL